MALRYPNPWLTDGVVVLRPWQEDDLPLLEKLGFVREGLLRSYASWRGSRQDVFLYSLLPSDLDPQRAVGRAHEG